MDTDQEVRRGVGKIRVRLTCGLRFGIQVGRTGFFRALKKPDSSLGITGSYRHDILALHTVFLTSLLGS
jgi:hypothetical protein